MFAAFVVFYIVTNNNGIYGKEHESYLILKWIFLALILIMIPIAIITHRKVTENIDSSLPLKEKLAVYRNSFIMKIGILDLFVCSIRFFYYSMEIYI